MGAFNTSDNLLQRLWSKVRSLENNTGGSGSSYEEITLASFQTASAAGTLTAGKTYAITDLLTSIGTFRLLLQGFNNTTDNGVQNGTLIYTNVINSSFAIWEVQFDIVNGVFLSFYNRASNVRCNSVTTFQALFSGGAGLSFTQGKITDCNFSNYTGSLSLEGNGYTTLKNCDFSNSSANFDTGKLNVVATFSGRILHDFEVPNQASFPCDFTNTIQINADGTNNMVATITLAAAQGELDYTGFESASIVKLVPDAGGNSITRISNNVQTREYKIVSDETGGLLSIDTGVNITINVVTDSVVIGQILWSGTWVEKNEIYFYRRSTESFILAKSNIYA